MRYGGPIRFKHAASRETWYGHRRSDRRRRYEWDDFDCKAKAPLRQIAPGLAGKKEGHYLDAEKFTALFRKNGSNRNRRLIAAAIYLIAQRYVERFGRRDSRGLWNAWRQDAASEAALLGIRKIWHYQTRCRHVNAFSYFTRLIQNKVREQLKLELCRAQGLAPWAWQTAERRKKREGKARRKSGRGK